MTDKVDKKLGELLIEAGYINEEQLVEALKKQRNSGKKLGKFMVEDGLITEGQMVDVLEFQLRVPRINFNDYNIDPSVPRMISQSLAQKHVLIPVGKEDRLLAVAMTDPLDLFAMDDVKIATGMEVRPYLATSSEIMTAIDRYYGRENTEKAVEDFKKQYNFDQIIESDVEALSEVNNAPVVRLVNSTIQHALRLRASDIHIEPQENYLMIRFRIDGDLQEIMKSSKTAHSAVITRLKIMGKMDIAEKRIPQDGRVEMNIDDKDVDLRLSVLPTVHGEKAVIRILGRSDMLLSREQLGFSPDNNLLFDKIIKNPNGIVLITGPTGSGKTTTLYAVLKEVNSVRSNIITVEDPVEYRLEGINQVQVNMKAGLTFANGLRSILRQDPDIIMVGEIRDAETAQIAVRAAITGHLVLSTIHTNDAASTISRLIDMGIEPFLVASSVVGVVAQRLVRRICPECRKAYNPDHSEMMLLKLKDIQPLYKGEGCSNCNHTGYKGRTAIHEVMLVSKDIREIIEKRGTTDQLRNMAGRMGTVSLRDSCIRLVLNGITTTQELVRMTYSMD
ncbi:MAG: GspE/PulE family protein [Clostridia bacterium]